MGPDNEVPCDAGGGGARFTDIKRSDVKLPPVGQCLEAGGTYVGTLTAMDHAGCSRCSGGDFYELDLRGGGLAPMAAPLLARRPPLVDWGNGTYTFTLSVLPLRRWRATTP